LEYSNIIYGFLICFTFKFGKCDVNGIE